ncbi:hypothetical protein SRHO_G00125880 [Serrasalmus rhombeus]
MPSEEGQEMESIFMLYCIFSYDETDTFFRSLSYYDDAASWTFPSDAFHFFTSHEEIAALLQHCYISHGVREASMFSYCMYVSLFTVTERSLLADITFQLLHYSQNGFFFLITIVFYLVCFFMFVENTLSGVQVCQYTNLLNFVWGLSERLDYFYSCVR